MHFFSTQSLICFKARLLRWNPNLKFQDSCVSLIFQSFIFGNGRVGILVIKNEQLGSVLLISISLFKIIFYLFSIQKEIKRNFFTMRLKIFQSCVPNQMHHLKEV